MSTLAAFVQQGLTTCALQTSALVGDWMQGLLLSILVVGVFLAVSALRDYLVRMDMNHDALGFLPPPQVRPCLPRPPIFSLHKLLWTWPRLTWAIFMGAAPENFPAPPG